MNPVICPVCRTRTGVCIGLHEWMCCVCGHNYDDTLFPLGESE